MQTVQAAAVLPTVLREPLERYLSQRELVVEEIRLRTGRPMTVASGGKEWAVLHKGSALIPDHKVMQDTLAAATGHSRYAVQEELAQGWCVLRGGHRLGICGEAVLDGQRVTGFRAVSSLNLRIAREHLNCASPLLALLGQARTGLLLGGLPGTGKTTLLRDAVRQLSDVLLQRIGLVDERGEVAACENGTPALDVGLHTDVITGAPKETGLYMLLRTMAPDWLAVDEVSSPADAEALIQAAYSGVRLLATVHLSDPEDLNRRPVYRKLISGGFFEQLVMLHPDRQLTVERIPYD